MLKNFVIAMLALIGVFTIISIIADKLGLLDRK